MIHGVRDIYYNVEDMARAVTFYKEALQMTLTFENPGWTSLACGGTRVGLHLMDPPANVFRVPRDSHGAHGQATLTLHSDDIPKDRHRIIERGGKILGEADEPWGQMLVFEDPDGNVLKLMNPKF